MSRYNQVYSPSSPTPSTPVEFFRSREFVYEGDGSDVSRAESPIIKPNASETQFEQQVQQEKELQEAGKLKASTYNGLLAIGIICCILVVCILLSVLLIIILIFAISAATCKHADHSEVFVNRFPASDYDYIILTFPPNSLENIITVDGGNSSTDLITLTTEYKMKNINYRDEFAVRTSGTSSTRRTIIREYYYTGDRSRLRGCPRIHVNINLPKGKIFNRIAFSGYDGQYTIANTMTHELALHSTTGKTKITNSDLTNLEVISESASISVETTTVTENAVLQTDTGSVTIDAVNSFQILDIRTDSSEIALSSLTTKNTTALVSVVSKSGAINIEKFPQASLVAVSDSSSVKIGISGTYAGSISVQGSPVSIDNRLRSAAVYSTNTNKRVVANLNGGGSSRISGTAKSKLTLYSY